MYDSIKIRLYNLPSDYDFAMVLSALDQVVIYENETGGHGKWRGRNVIATTDYVQFEGSLPKCLYGNNLRSLTLSEVKKLITKMSDDLGVPMNEAEVLDLEFAHNFIMQHQPIKYMNMLIGIPKFKDNSWDGTRYFEYGGIRVKFYDKVKEAKKKRELPKYGDIPPYQLRYEVTFESNKLETIFGKTLIMDDLWNKEVFWRLVSEWYEYYELLENRPQSSKDIDFNDFKSVKDFDKWVICMLNDEQNLGYYIKHILFKHRSSPSGADRVLHGQIQKRIKEALKWSKVNLPKSDLMGELTMRIEAYLTDLYTMSADGLTTTEFEQMINNLSDKGI